MKKNIIKISALQYGALCGDRSELWGILTVLRYLLDIVQVGSEEYITIKTLLKEHYPDSLLDMEDEDGTD